MEQRHQLRHFQVVAERIFRTDQAVLIVELKKGDAALAAQLQAHLEIDQQPELTGGFQGVAQCGATEHGKADDAVGG
ncbi:hypothetical protein D3C72_2461700 [compost metagenome]